MKHENTEPEKPSWDAAVLVCKVCRKRSSGPKGMKSKDVVQEARRALKDVRPRPRVVMTSCLGLCPKGATAVAFVGHGAPRIVAVSSIGGVAHAVESLAG